MGLDGEKRSGKHELWGYIVRFEESSSIHDSVCLCFPSMVVWVSFFV